MRKPRSSLVYSPYFGLYKVCVSAHTSTSFSTQFFPPTATWIALVGLPVYLCNTLPASAHPALGLCDYAALSLFTTSFLFEVVADNQKSVWRRAKDDKQHDEKFITSGLWSVSRHPKYVYSSAPQSPILYAHIAMWAKSAYGRASGPSQPPRSRRPTSQKAQSHSPPSAPSSLGSFFVTYVQILPPSISVQRYDNWFHA